MRQRGGGRNNADRRSVNTWKTTLIRKMLIVIATLLIGAPIAIIIKALWTILLAFLLVVALIRTIRRSTNLLVPALRSWWRCKRQVVVVVSVWIASGAALIIAWIYDCRYLCQQWQSTGLDLLAAVAGFWLGMIIAGALESSTMPRKEWVEIAIGSIALLAVPTALVLIPDFPNGAAILIWTLGLPVLGEAAKRLWPWLFCGRRDRLSSCDTPNAHRERPGASFDD